MAFKTYGELRQQLKAEGIRWTVNPAFPDDAPIKRPGLGADLTKVPPAKNIGPVDVAALVAKFPTTNTLLREHLIERGFLPGTLKSISGRGRFMATPMGSPSPSSPRPGRRLFRPPACCKAAVWITSSSCVVCTQGLQTCRSSSHGPSRQATVRSPTSRLSLQSRRRATEEACRAYQYGHDLECRVACLSPQRHAAFIYMKTIRAAAASLARAVRPQ